MKKLFIFFIILSITLSASAKSSNDPKSKLNEKLYKAAGDSDIKLISKLLSEGADINALSGALGWTPLMKVLFGKSSKEKLETFNFLLKNGADVNVKGTSGGNALHLAACSSTRMEEVKQLVAAGIDVNLQNENGTTPLINAVFFVNKDIAEFLINSKANLNTANKKGMTPLMTACDDRNAVQIAAMLINAKADLNLKNEKGETALKIAKKKNITETIDLLVKAGAVE